MPFMPWGPQLTLGIKSFDDEHLKLVGLVNELYDAMQAGHGRQALAKIIDGLIAYTKTHFGHEEMYLSLHGYPDLAKHRGEHAGFTRHVTEIQAQYKAGTTASLTIETLTFLRAWLLDHILVSDKKYLPTLANKHVS